MALVPPLGDSLVETLSSLRTAPLCLTRLDKVAYQSAGILRNTRKQFGPTSDRRPAGLKTMYDQLGLSKDEFTKLSEQFRHDAAWFHGNLEKLRRRHAGRYVAVLGGKIIAEDREIDEVIREIHASGANSRLTFVGFVTPKPIELI